MTDKWQFYSQTGVDGPEYGIRIRPGYTVVGFQLEDARQIVAWQNASIQPEGDILGRAKAVVGKCHLVRETELLLPELIAEVERLRSENISLMRTAQTNAQQVEMFRVGYNDMVARCEDLEANQTTFYVVNSAYIKRLEAAFLEAKRCPTCNGKGMIRHTVMHRVDGRMEDRSFNQVCPLCDGRGEEKAREALEGIKEGGKDE